MLLEVFSRHNRTCEAVHGEGVAGPRGRWIASGCVHLAESAPANDIQLIKVLDRELKALRSQVLGLISIVQRLRLLLLLRVQLHLFHLCPQVLLTHLPVLLQFVHTCVLSL